MTTLQELPKEIQLFIYQNLMPRDIITVPSTCKGIREVVMNDFILSQNCLMDHYDEYAVNDKAKEVLNFDSIIESNPEDCLYRV